MLSSMKAVGWSRVSGCVLVLCALLGACGGRNISANLDPDMARAVAENRALAKELAAGETNPVPRDVWRFFDLVEANNFQRATNLFERLQKQSSEHFNPTPPRNGLVGLFHKLFGSSSESPPAPALQGASWCPVHETLGMAESFHDWDNGLLHRFGRDIIDSIPTNSIYFGGTDPGRFVITALSQSHREGRPFFTLTQNAMADGRYLDYLRRIYGGKIYIPTAEDSQEAFNLYLRDAQQRLKSNELRPGEDVRVVNNRVQISGQVAVMQVNGLLVKVIFDHSPGQEFYVEESFPLDWMYPHLSPHGLILKLNREPLPALEEPVTRKDHEYWRNYAGQLVGDWLTDTTPVKRVCDFVDQVYLKKDLAAFTGDQAFVRNETARKAFSKLRSSIAGVYAWRYNNAKTPEDKARMLREADYAFRQAFALCPSSPEAVFRYVNLLLNEGRRQDALLIAETCERVDPQNPQMANLVGQLKKLP